MLTAYFGKITPEMLVEHVRRVDPKSTSTLRCWITYLDDTVDVSEVDLTAQLQVRELASAKFRESGREARLRTALVCRSRLNRPHLSLWQACTRADPNHLFDSQLFESLKEACDWLELDADAWRRLAAIVEAHAETDTAAKPQPLPV